MTEYHQQSTAEVMKILNVTTQGLTDDDVQKRQQVYGYNVLEEGKRQVRWLFYGPIQRFIGHHFTRCCLRFLSTRK